MKKTVIFTLIILIGMSIPYQLFSNGVQIDKEATTIQNTDQSLTKRDERKLKRQQKKESKILLKEKKKLQKQQKKEEKALRKQQEKEDKSHLKEEQRLQKQQERELQEVQRLQEKEKKKLQKQREDEEKSTETTKENLHIPTYPTRVNPKQIPEQSQSDIDKKNVISTNQREQKSSNNSYQPSQKQDREKNQEGDNPLNSVSTWLIIVGLAFVGIVTSRYQRKCSSCNKWNAMRDVEKKLINVHPSRNSKNKEVYFYRIRQQCSYCGHQDYSEKREEREIKS